MLGGKMSFKQNNIDKTCAATSCFWTEQNEFDLVHSLQSVVTVENVQSQLLLLQSPGGLLVSGRTHTQEDAQDKCLCHQEWNSSTSPLAAHVRWTSSNAIPLLPLGRVEVASLLVNICTVTEDCNLCIMQSKKSNSLPQKALYSIFFSW